MDENMMRGRGAGACLLVEEEPHHQVEEHEEQEDTFCPKANAFGCGGKCL